MKSKQNNTTFKKEDEYNEEDYNNYIDSSEVVLNYY